MTQERPLFGTDPGHITDFAKKSAAEIYNQSVVPRVNAFDTMDFLEEGRQRRTAQLESDLAQEAFSRNADDEFLRGVMDNRAPTGGDEPDFRNLSIDPADLDMDSESGPIKLSNYGYDDDSSPDYNSNVLRIGNRDNKLVDGVSAALTASLAKRLGIKPGQEFEAVTDKGEVYRRRYDDTVPTTYKGKPLPETVDLYNRKGSNSFGGVVVKIRPLTKGQSNKD
jgi:bifunctional DNA-binding transcriptional regulator/antitoxin component of YhaV-PrlF toxin-antitoxin module